MRAQATSVADRNPDVQVQLGVLFCKRARWREAIEPLRAAVAADPQHAAAHYHLGDAYNAVDDLPAALGAYERAAQLEPTNARPLLRIEVPPLPVSRLGPKQGINHSRREMNVHRPAGFVLIARIA